MQEARAACVTGDVWIHQDFPLLSHNRSNRRVSRAIGCFSNHRSRGRPGSGSRRTAPAGTGCVQHLEAPTRARGVFVAFCKPATRPVTQLWWRTSTSASVLLTKDAECASATLPAPRTSRHPSVVRDNRDGGGVRVHSRG